MSEDGKISHAHGLAGW
jgi:hypothetical protein